MIVIVENNTSNTVKLNYNNEFLFISPYKEKRIDISLPTLFEINNKSNEKSFIQRVKEDFSFNEIDFNHLRFKINYSSYLKTIVNIIPDKYKRPRLIIKEKIYIKNNLLELHCLDVDNIECVDCCKYKCVNMQHKLALYFSCKFAIVLKYGILGIVGLLFCISLFLDFDSFLNDGTGAMVCYIIASIIFITYFIVFFIKSIWLFKIIKSI
ncbi:MAG: hypothetical protein NC213_06335 [Acetobacter sp.]|nr:hypothetical protein [Bacteroides sp.]MCM1341343.1 hypothetical protein [Acetobacter sp.]MCM1433435.1 hypothetical protein [Clostridiales bacterium]